MLFSEPKIPQFDLSDNLKRAVDCFSALQRAENSSMRRGYGYGSGSAGFSALQRAENSSICSITAVARVIRCFSALQRAENSSITRKNRPNRGVSRFQCSSASRKFLNADRAGAPEPQDRVSVLFSEPKIPQSLWALPVALVQLGFSALQRAENSSMRNLMYMRDALERFSALQRAENSSIRPRPTRCRF